MSEAFERFGPLDLDNVQGDIVLGLPKKAETFFFFKIDESNLPEFRRRLCRVIPFITTTGDVQQDHEKINAEKRRAKKAGRKPDVLNIGGLNIAFSHLGVKTLELEKSGDAVFDKGMNNDDERKDLGDGEWAPEFVKDIDGVIITTGHNVTKADGILAKVLHLLGNTITEVTRVTGKVRPKPVEAHEHFGYADGIAQPIVQGFPGTAHPGKDVIDQGIIFAGRKDDTVPFTKRPSWTIDGSFLCFRKLKQLVPEFSEFLEAHKLPTTDTTPPDPKIGRLSAGAELLGARLVGRWKSGAPVERSDLVDNLNLATHPHVNDDFRYDQSIGQKNCPYAAHTRKTNPRDDVTLTDPEPRRNEVHRIMRHGIQYGKEVTQDERDNKKSSTKPSLERGLLFVCYQSNLGSGFRFIQRTWVNNVKFPPKPDAVPGFDALIGVNAKEDDPPRHVNGHDPANLPTSLTPTEEEKLKQQLKLDKIWVETRGGEYFFSPSISSLKKHFGKAEQAESKMELK